MRSEVTTQVFAEGDQMGRLQELTRFRSRSARWRHPGSAAASHLRTATPPRPSRVRLPGSSS